VESEAAVGVFVADDLVVAEIGAGLHFKQRQRDAAGVVETMPAAQRQVDALVFADQNLILVPGHDGRAFDHDPCSARWKWLCSGSFSPDLTTMRLTWKRSLRISTS
jgi:hypothetical protein